MWTTGKKNLSWINFYEFPVFKNFGNADIIEFDIFALKFNENGFRKRPLEVFERAQKMVVDAGNCNIIIVWSFNCT
jgi:hypothetical protein